VISCRPLERAERPAWDRYVRAHLSGSPFHLMAWHDTLCSIFGYRPAYHVAVEHAEIVGVLPMFIANNFLTGKVLISTPFAVYGGILASHNGAHEALRDQMKALAYQEGVQHAELRNSFAHQVSGFSGVDRYCTFTRDVKPQAQDELLGALPQKTRNMVRKALKQNFTTRKARDLDSFYGLLLETYRRHGTPAFPKHFFTTIAEKFGHEVDVREVLLDGKVIAASLNFLYGRQMHTYYAASSRDCWKLNVNDFMYFDHIMWAGQNDCDMFDFGRSKIGTGPFEFKKHWGATMRPLPYEVMLVKRRELPNFSQTNPKFDMAVRVWQKMPLAVTRLIGPRLVALFP
jgi:FemAB-related protein (PEP-CTERM system-associated)